VDGLGLDALARTPAPSSIAVEAEAATAPRQERGSRGRRGGTASRMSGSQKRAARREREGLVLASTLAGDEDDEPFR